MRRENRARLLCTRVLHDAGMMNGVGVHSGGEFSKQLRHRNHTTRQEHVFRARLQLLLVHISVSRKRETHAHTIETAHASRRRFLCRSVKHGMKQRGLLRRVEAPSRNNTGHKHGARTRVTRTRNNDATFSHLEHNTTTNYPSTNNTTG